MFTAGIASGYFMLDRARPACAAGFAVSVLAAAALSDADVTEAVTAERKARALSVRQILTAFFLCGLLIFVLRSSAYDRVSDRAGQSAEIRVRVTSAELKDDTLKMTVKSEDERGLGMLVTVPVYGQGGDVYDLTGTVIAASGTFETIPPADDPGCFDYALYMRSRSICCGFRTYSFDIEDPGNTLSAETKRYLYRERERFLDCFDEDTAAFLRGVIFGDRSGMDEETVREFNDNSTGHILAVSGLHMGFLYALLKTLTGRKKSIGISVLIMAVIIMYGTMTMWSPATVRACLVMGISLASVPLKRNFDLLTSVSLAALILLIKEPYQLFSTGFRMSFLAMLGIALLAGPIASVTGKVMGTMMAVQLGTLPVVMRSYYRFDPLAMLINIPIMLLTSVLVPVCLILLLGDILTGRVPQAGVYVTGLIADSVRLVNHWLSFDGAFTIRTGGPAACAVTAFYMAVFGLSSEWVRIRLLRHDTRSVMKRAALLLMPVLMLCACLYDPFPDDGIVFVAVGQGDCVHIRSEGRDVLIDGGGSESYNVGERILMPYLLYSGADNADMALVTHLHTDHYKGITELAADYPVGAIGIPAYYRESVSSTGIGTFEADKIVFMGPGTRIDVSEDVYIEVIWPVTEESGFSADDPNEHNTVYMVHYKGLRVMVTGDLLEEDELQMVEYYRGTDTLKCDVLKVAHHGSRTSSSEAFLDAASPSIAVIQAGRNNIYGHPHAQTLERLEERGITVMRTDIHGAIGLEFRRGRLSIDLFHAN